MTDPKIVAVSAMVKVIMDDLPIPTKLAFGINIVADSWAEAIMNKELSYENAAKEMGERFIRMLDIHLEIRKPLNLD